MEPNPSHSSGTLEPPAPVAGGIRWRRRYHDIFDSCRHDRGLILCDPEKPEKEPSIPEQGMDGAPLIPSIPPPEARAGAEYIYPARAFDGITNGFTWYFEKSPAGMRVDRHTGKVSWTPSEGGYVDVILAARSLYGAASRQCWTICVRRAAVVHNPVVNARYRAALQKKAARAIRPLLTPWTKAKRQNLTSRRATAPPGARPPAAIPLRI